MWLKIQCLTGYRPTALQMIDSQGPGSASKLGYDWKNGGVARFCHGNNFVMKGNISIHIALKVSHIPSNSKKYINSI